jgi:hypothetical protein
MRDSQRRALARKLAADIGKFDRKCEREEYTDVGDVWALLHTLRATLTEMGK